MEQESTDHLTEVALNSEEIIELAKQDPDVLASLATPEMFEFNWPHVFVSIWYWLTEVAHKPRSFDKLAIGLPRGFGKTTLIKLYILYCILFTKKQFILILSENATKAGQIIADVIDMLDEKNIVSLFGNWRLSVETDTIPLKKFSFRGRPIVLAGLGQGGSVRGLNVKNLRPDVIVFEDVQSREDADSPIVSDGIFKWMLGTAMKAKSPKGCLFIFIANMYPTPNSILKKLKNNPFWTSYIYGGILQDPETKQLSSLWEELQPLAQLMQEWQSDAAAGKGEIFLAEVMNDETASVNTAIDTSNIPSFPYEEDDIHQGNYIVIDPAVGKANRDAVTVMYYQVFDGKPVCWELAEGPFSPGETIRQALKYCLKYGCRLVAIEGNAYQATLCYWFNFICKQMGISGITAVPIFSGRSSKNSRILEMFKQLAPQKSEGSPYQPQPELWLHPRTKAQVLAQIHGFEPLKGDNIDGILDCLTYGTRVIVEFGKYLLTQTTLEELKLEEANRAYEDISEIELSPF